MKKFSFSMSAVVEAGSLEEALSKVAGHVATVGRRVSSEHDLADCGAQFSISETSDDAKATDLRPIEHEPIDLNLDPKSSAGVSLVAQREREETERQAAKRARANDGKTDAEIMAEHSAKEQAALNQPVS